jgi:hypothetical protein
VHTCYKTKKEIIQMIQKKMATLAALAMCGATLLSATAPETTKESGPACTQESCNKNLAAGSSGNSMSMMSAEEQKFCDKLNPGAQAMFKSMSSEGRSMAMSMATNGMEPSKAVEMAAAKMGQKK